VSDVTFVVLTVLKMSVVVFWVVTLCGLVGSVGCNVSEHTACIFSPEDPEDQHQQCLVPYIIELIKGVLNILNKID
jgi:hypothetical protein